MKKTASSHPPDVQTVLAWLRDHSSKAILEGMARYAIPSENALGVAVKDIKSLGKQLGRNHALAAALWKTGVYEARMLVSFVAEPDRLTPAQMDCWCSEFDNWAICDTMCFHLFDRTPHAWTMVERWSGSDREFVKRTAFALIWSLALHDKNFGDEAFLESLSRIEQASSDPRNFVKKAVSMALRAVGRRNAKLRREAAAVSRRLAASEDATQRWIGKGTLKDLA